VKSSVFDEAPRSKFAEKGGMLGGCECKMLAVAGVQNWAIALVCHAIVYSTLKLKI